MVPRGVEGLPLVLASLAPLRLLQCTVIRMHEPVPSSLLLLVVGLQALISSIYLVVSYLMKNLIGWHFSGQSESASTTPTFVQPEPLELLQFELDHLLEAQRAEPSMVSRLASLSPRVVVLLAVVPLDSVHHWLLALQLSLAPLPL